MFSQGSAFLNGDHRAYQGQMNDQEPQLFGSAKTFFGYFFMRRGDRAVRTSRFPYLALPRPVPLSPVYSKLTGLFGSVWIKWLFP